MPGRRLEGEDRAEPAVHERGLQAPLLEQFRHQVDGVPLADPAKIDLHTACRGMDDRLVGVELE